MRFIDLSKLSLPCGWEHKVEQAQQYVRTIQGDRDRAKEINKQSAIWRELKPCLEELSHKKCWYCESRQIRSDMNVDHYRPKNRVNKIDCQNHPGYWWLSFDWHNFRYCCTYCNSRRKDSKTGQTRGKADRFPLGDETKRCYIPEEFITEEQPILLDPTDVADPTLLWFDEDGTAQPRYSTDQASWLNVRAKESIEIYHLNHTDLKESRQVLCNMCKEKVKEADQVWAEYRHGAEVGTTKFKQIVEELLRWLAISSEYTAAAQSTLMGLRSDDRPWLDELLTRT
jgi:uncharacterized protein (TIGR02646 family)